MIRRLLGDATVLGVTMIALLAAVPAAADNYDPNGSNDPPWFCVQDEDTPPADCPLLAPGPEDSPCAGHWQECVCVPKLYRRDHEPEKIQEGRETEIVGGRLECNFCEPRCLTANPPTTVHVCTETHTITLTRTFEFVLAFEVGVGIDALKAKLGENFGWNHSTSYTCEITLGSSQMPSCFRNVYTARVKIVKGSIYRVRHEYAKMDVLVESPNNVCGVASDETYVLWNHCPTPRFSTCKSDWWVIASAHVASEFCGAPQDLKPSNSFAPLGPDDIWPLILWPLW